MLFVLILGRNKHSGYAILLREAFGRKNSYLNALCRKKRRTWKQLRFSTFSLFNLSIVPPLSLSTVAQSRQCDSPSICLTFILPPSCAGAEQYSGNAPKNTGTHAKEGRRARQGSSARGFSVKQPLLSHLWPLHHPSSPFLFCLLKSFSQAIHPEVVGDIQSCNCGRTSKMGDLGAKPKSLCFPVYCGKHFMQGFCVTHRWSCVPQNVTPHLQW